MTDFDESTMQVDFPVVHITMLRRLSAPFSDGRRQAPPVARTLPAAFPELFLWAPTVATNRRASSSRLGLPGSCCRQAHGQGCGSTLLFDIIVASSKLAARGLGMPPLPFQE